MRTVWDPLSKGEVARLIKRRKPAIVQTYMGRATRLTHLKPGQGPVHVARLGGYYKPDGYRHAHAWIGNTKGVCDYLLHQGFPKDRVFHLGNFIDPPAQVSEEHVWQLKRTFRTQDSYVLMCLGRLVPVKGICYLIEAISQLPKTINGRPVLLIVLGKGELEQRLRQLAEQLEINDRIRWAGWQTEPGPFYQLADVVVFPSLEQETLGNIILESWSHSRPILCSQFPGAIELTRHGQDAWQVPCRDSRALAQGIQNLLQDDDLRNNLAKNGHNRALTEFNRERIVHAYLELYRGLVG